MKHIVHIYGPCGSGTSTLGREIGRRLGFRFLDTDDFFWMPTDPQYTQKRPLEERLALLEEFAEDENAMFYLWKDHSAFAEAEEVNEAFRHGSDTDYTKYQGNYCAEWYWAKILHAVRTDQRIREAAYTWEEHSDWMVGVMCGETRPDHIFHGACAAGHKAYWHSEWGGLPAKEVLEKLDPYLVQVRERYGNAPQPAVVKAGNLCPEWAKRLGLSTDVVISGSSFDAHAGAVGAGIREKTLICTMGTSAVDMIVEKAENLEGKDIKRFCGQAENSILPDLVGVEIRMISRKR